MVKKCEFIFKQLLRYELSSDWYTGTSYMTSHTLTITLALYPSLTPS